MSIPLVELGKKAGYAKSVPCEPLFVVLNQIDLSFEMRAVDLID